MSYHKSCNKSIDILSGISDTKIAESLKYCSELSFSNDHKCYECPLKYNAVYDGRYTCMDVLMLEASKRLQKYIDMFYW